MIGPSLGSASSVRRIRGADAITIRAAVHAVRDDTQQGGIRDVFAEAKIWTRAELLPDDAIEWRGRVFSVERSRQLAGLWIGELWRVEGASGRVGVA